MIEPFIFAGFIALCLLGGKLARMDGGGEPKTPEIVERTFCMLYFFLACVPFAGAYALAAFIGGVGLAVGHGPYFLSCVWKRLTDMPGVDFIVAWFFGPDIRTTQDFDPQTTHPKHEKKLYRRNLFGMFVTGSLVGLPAALIALCFGQWLAAILFSLTGFVKVIAYVVGHEVFRSTVEAEWINGTLRSALALTVLLLSI